MNTTFRSTLKTFALGLILASSLHSAQASASHTYVSGVTTAADTIPCSRTAPCATFQFAVDNTSQGGIVTALDAGDYGPIVISQAVTIDGSGTQASIVLVSGTAITINGDALDIITLRHLAITGVSTSGNGIVLSTGNVVVDDCQISGLSNSDGLILASLGTSIVENTIITGCNEGIFIHNANGSTGLVSLRSVTSQGNQIGLDAEGGPTDISHSLITQNSFAGLYALGGTLSASDCMISSNATGVSANNGSVIRLTGNDIFNNPVGIATFGNTPGIVSTALNNHKAGSTTPGAPTQGKIIVTQ